MPNRAARHATLIATAKALLREYEAGGKTHAELAKERGVTRARVSQYIAVARLARDVAEHPDARKHREAMESVGSITPTSEG